MTAIAKLSKGYLPPEIFTPSKFKMIAYTILSVVKKTNPTHALPNMILYYDMELVTFGVDEN